MIDAGSEKNDAKVVVGAAGNLGFCVQCSVPVLDHICRYEHYAWSLEKLSGVATIIKLLSWVNT